MPPSTDSPPDPLFHPLLAGLYAAGGRSAPVRFAHALGLPLRAARFVLGQPRLWPFVAVPALVNVVLFVAGAGLVLAYAGDMLGAVWARPEAAALAGWVLLALWYAAFALVVGLGLVLAYVLVLLAGGIVASPFNDALSERTERVLTGRPVPQPDAPWWREAARSIASSAAVAGIYVALLAPVLLLNLVPVAGSLAATVLGWGLGAFFLSVEFTEGALARRGLRLRDRLALLRANAASALGFGLGTSLLLWIPLLNFVTIPVAVVAGAALGRYLADRR